jgi:hypothetical protein
MAARPGSGALASPDEDHEPERKRGEIDRETDVVEVANVAAGVRCPEQIVREARSGTETEFDRT